MQEITAPMSSLPADPVSIAADVDFPIAFRGYDRLAVDAYVKKTSQLVAELRSTRSPEAAVRRALERVGEEISGILKRAHETADQITTQSRREAEDRLVAARQEAAEIAAAGEQRVKDLDADADRIWAERARIIDDARELASQLMALADDAAQRFPPAEEAADAAVEEPPPPLYDAEQVPYDAGEATLWAGREPDGAEGAQAPAEPLAEDPDPTAALPRPEEIDDAGETAVMPTPDGEADDAGETAVMPTPHGEADDAGETAVMPPVHPPAHEPSEGAADHDPTRSGEPRGWPE